MKIVLDTISSPATGSTARRIARAVDRGSSVVNAQGKAFIASLMADLRPGKKSARRKQA
jgi:hypothetical protein